MSDIFREVDEDIRREQFQKLWAQYGLFVIIGVVLVVLITSGVMFWRWQVTERMEASSEQYAAALDTVRSGDPEATAAAFGALAGEVNAGYATLSRLHEAASLASAGKADEAVALYDSIAIDSGVTPILREVATYKAALLVADTAGYDELAGRLVALTAPGSALRHMANELLGLSAMKDGRTDEARAHFEEVVSSMDASMGLRQRVSAMLTQLGRAEPLVDAGAPSEEMPPAGVATPDIPAPSATETEAPAANQPENNAADGNGTTDAEEQGAIDE